MMKLISRLERRIAGIKDNVQYTDINIQNDGIIPYYTQRVVIKRNNIAGPLSHNSRK